MAFDGASDRLRGVWREDYYAMGLFADPTHGKLYCLGEPRFVTVVDPLANEVLADIPLPGYPEAIAFNAADHKVYVAVDKYEEEGDALAVIDALGDSMLAEIPLAHSQDYLAYDADRDLLYAADYYSRFVLAIDGKSDCVVDSFHIHESPVGLVYNNATHRLYILGSTEITVKTPGVHGQNNYITTGAALPCFVLDPSGTELYGSSPNSESLYFIDCVGESLARVIPVSAPAAALSYDYEHDRLYCAHGDVGGVSVVDCAKGFVRAAIPVSASSVYWDAGTDAVYCLGDSGLTVVDGRTHRLLATLKIRWPVGVASAPDWPRVYVADYDSPCLAIIRTDSGPRVRAVPDEQATIARGSLRWAGKEQAAVFDRTGRRVGNLHPGENDVGRLAPGVYFVRDAQAEARAVRKVVVTR